MKYRIKEVTRLGLKQSIGILYSDSGERLGRVESWSAAGCLTALRQLARRLSKQSA